MICALIEKGAVKTYPYSLGQLRSDFNTSFSEDVATAIQQAAEFGVVEVLPTDPPVVDETKDVTEATPVLVNGVWTQTWTVTDADPAVVARRQANIADDAARTAVKADAFVKAFVAMSPDEVASYVNTNITNIASAKAVIAKLAIMVLVLVKRSLR